MSLLKRKKFLVLATVSGLLGTLIAGVEKTPETDTSNSIIQYNSKQAAKIDLVFVLDTTGSMSGLIRGAKEKIWSIVNTMSQAKPTPEIRVGLIGYRDRSDAYITDLNQLTSDIDSIYTKLMSYRAVGGGDRPESVNQGINEAIEKMSWDKDKKTYRVVFLVGDSPPHMDYRDDVKYNDTCKIAQKKDIVINTVLCGGHNDTRKIWQEIAENANGSFFEVEQSGGAVIIATPYDKKIADLSSKLDKTRIPYGDVEKRHKYVAKQANVNSKLKSASFAAKAQRMEFNTSKAGEKNFGGDCDLLIQISSNKVTVDKIDAKKLPEKFKNMSSAQIKKYVQEQQKKRQEITKEIRNLSARRQQYIQQEAKKRGKFDKSFEKNIFDSVTPQMRKKSIFLDKKDLKL